MLSLSLPKHRFHEFSTSISRPDDHIDRMMEIQIMVVSAAITGFLIFALFLESIASSPKDR
jgi:hypothetical protein